MYDIDDTETNGLSDVCVIIKIVAVLTRTPSATLTCQNRIERRRKEKYSQMKNGEDRKEICKQKNKNQKRMRRRNGQIL